MKNYIEIEHNYNYEDEVCTDVYHAVRPTPSKYGNDTQFLRDMAREPWKFDGSIHDLNCVEAYRKLLDAIEEVLKEEEQSE